MTTIHTLFLLVTLGGIGSILFGGFATFAEGMADTSANYSGGCTFVIGGAIAVVVGIVGMLL